MIRYGNSKVLRISVICETILFKVLYGVDSRIIEAKPTDGLWEDGRTDEDQLGASYPELEEAMEKGTGPAVDVLERYNRMNKHKMEPIPTFKLGV